MHFSVHTDGITLSPVAILPSNTDTKRWLQNTVFYVD